MTFTKKGGAKNAVGIGNTALGKRAYRKETSCLRNNCANSSTPGTNEGYPPFK